MALSADSQPYFTTIADFISRVHRPVGELFLQILMVCDQLDLIGKDMFAIDGRKMFFNVSKEWSGTYQEQVVDRLSLTLCRCEKQNRQSTGQENLRQTPCCCITTVCSHAGDGTDQANAKRSPESEWPVAAYVCPVQSKKDTRLWR